MKKLFALLLTACLLLSLAACSPAASSNNGSDTSSQQTDVSKPDDTDVSTPEDTEQSAVLYADFSYGASDAESIKQYPITYTGDKKDALALADELSKLTGLDFFITVSDAADGITVDWAANSTLIANLDDREQKEEFFFFDIDSLRWFMMDSLWQTLSQNLDVENVYYTMDGGKELTFDELSLLAVYPEPAVLPSDTPYMGSPFYAAHSDNKGDEEGGVFARTKGLWRLDGATDTASIEMDGNGNFTTYYASGSIETVGYLDYVDEYDDGNLRYDMYTAEGEWIAGFYFDSDTQLHIGNEDAAVYYLDTDSVNAVG